MVCTVIQTTLDDAIEQGRVAMESVAKTAGELFLEAAQEFVLSYLEKHGATNGEDLTYSCLQAGIVPHDDRAFGHVYRSLSRARRIEKCGFVARKRGHGTSGGNVWRLVKSDG